MDSKCIEVHRSASKCFKVFDVFVFHLFLEIFSCVNLCDLRHLALLTHVTTGEGVGHRGHPTASNSGSSPSHRAMPCEGQGDSALRQMCFCLGVEDGVTWIAPSHGHTVGHGKPVAACYLRMTENRCIYNILLCIDPLDALAKKSTIRTTEHFQSDSFGVGHADNT